MKKSDLKHGNVVEIRDGTKLLFCPTLIDNELIELTGCGFTFLDDYNENLLNVIGCVTLDIMKVYKDYTCKELLWERKEKPQLTEDEKVILRNLPKDYKWIARDKNGTICVFNGKPYKHRFVWDGQFMGVLALFQHLFQFIQWEDKEPYSIEELLKGEE